MLTGGASANVMRRIRCCLRVTLVLFVGVAGCSGAGGPVATVDGESIDRAALEQLHPADTDVTADERASSVLLLILHRLLVRSAEEEFDVSVTRAARQAAFAKRTDGLGADVDAALRSRGITRDRVRLEADLDVVRDAVQARLVRDGGSKVDLDAAYRTFLSVNSRVCLAALEVSDDSVTSAIEDLVDSGADVADVEHAYAGSVTRLDAGCASPTQFGPGLASVAVDGTIGQAYVVSGEGGPLVAAVTERDAPPADEVRAEILKIAEDTQGPELFNAWAAGIVRAAEVDVADAIGRWQPDAGTHGIPTVVTEP